MNRQEAIEIINTTKILSGRMSGKTAFIEALERLKESLTLAEFLGWEEGAEYMCLAGKYKVVDGELLRYCKVMQDYRPTKVYLNHPSILHMRRAKRVKPKKKYRIPLPHLTTTDGMQQYLTEKGGIGSLVVLARLSSKSGQKTSFLIFLMLIGVVQRR